jgi:hypothetical protein
MIAMLWLTGCAMASFEGESGVCPPMVYYSRAEQARAVAEVGALPPDAVIGGWLAAYAVLRDQARVCE